MAAWFNEEQRQKLEDFYSSWDGVYYGKNEERFQDLMKSTGLSRLQVRGWLRNRRNRGVYKGRIVHSVLQVRGLEWIYKNYAEYPTSHLKKKVGLAITMDPEQVNKWFETRRRRGTPKAALRTEHDQTPEWLSLLSALRRVVIEDSNGVNQKAFRDLKKKKKEENSFVSHYRLNNGAGAATNVPIMTKIAPTMTPYQSQNSFRDDFRFIGSTLASSFAASIQDSPPQHSRTQGVPLSSGPSPVAFPGFGPLTLANATNAVIGSSGSCSDNNTLPHHQAPQIPPHFPSGRLHHTPAAAMAPPPPRCLPPSVALSSAAPVPQQQQQRCVPVVALPPLGTQKPAPESLIALVAAGIPCSSSATLAVGGSPASPTSGEGTSHKYSIDFLCS